MSAKNNVRKTKKNTRPQQRPSLSGRGDYTLSSGEIAGLNRRLDNIDKKLPDVKAGFGKLGSRLGGAFGLGDLGKTVGQGAASLFGFGDYHVVSNSLMKSVDHSLAIVPKFGANGNNGVRVREREYLGDVVSGAANTFTNLSYPITPGSTLTFPWLSTVANQFDQWEPNGIVFEFVATSSDFNGSAQGLGTVIMATDYDVLDAPYPNKISMGNSDYSSSCKPSANQMHGVECDPKQRPYTLLYNCPVTRPIANNNTLGNFQIATAGVSAAKVTLGELWVSYDITFYKKQLERSSVPHATFQGDFTDGAWFATPIVLAGDYKLRPAVPTAPNQMYLVCPAIKGRFMAAFFTTNTLGGSDFNLLPGTGTFVVQRDSASVIGRHVTTIVFETDGRAHPELLAVFTAGPAAFSLAVTEVPFDYVF